MALNSESYPIIKGETEQDKAKNRIQAEHAVKEFLTTEKTFQQGLSIAIASLVKFQEKVKSDPKKSIYIKELISAYSKIYGVSEKTIRILEKGNALEDKLLAVKKGYTREHAQEYFDAIYPISARQTELLEYFAQSSTSLSKKELNELKVIFEEIEKKENKKEFKNQPINSYLILPVQRGPRHRLLFEPINNLTLDYFKDTLNYVKANATLLNEKMKTKEYVNEKFSSFKGLISKVSLGGSEEKFLTNMLITLGNEFLKAKGNHEWDSYIEKIENFKMGTKGKVLNFLQGLAEDAEKFKSTDEKMTDAMLNKQIDERKHELENLESKGLSTKIKARYKSMKRATESKSEIKSGIVAQRKNDLLILKDQKLSTTGSKLIDEIKPMMKVQKMAAKLENNVLEKNLRKPKV